MRSQNVRFVAIVFGALLGSFMLSPVLAQPTEVERLSVVVSIQPWADVVSRIGGDRVTVSTLLPSGASPHSYEPLPSQAATLAEADLVVTNGGLDSWLERLVAATAPRAATVNLMSEVDFEPLQETPHEPEENMSDDGRSVDVHANPHIWLDPSIVVRAVAVIAAALSELDPEGTERYSLNAEQLVTELEQVDREIESMLEGLEGATFVPFHDAWGYFARRYGLTVGAVLEPFAGREPSVRFVAETVQQIRESGAQVVFGERQLNDRTAQVVAESAGVRVVTLDPLGGAPGAESYSELLRENAMAIAEALRR